MNITKAAATAVLAVAATCVTAATANAAPSTTGATATAAPAAKPGLNTTPASFANASRVIRGSESGVGYTVTRSTRGSAVEVALDGGSFAVRNNTLTVSDRAGKVVSAMPVSFTLNGQQVSLAPTLSQNRRHVVLEPIGHWVTTSDKQDVMTQGVLIGAVLGAVPGAIIGAILGFGILSFITFPIGFIGGGLIGGLIGGGIANTIPADPTPHTRWAHDCHDLDYAENHVEECFNY